MLLEKVDADILHMLLAATYKLRNCLDVADIYVNYRQPDSKQYYIATVLDQMLSLETTMLRWNEDFVIGDEIEPDTLLLSIIQAAYNEVQMYRRKNLEILAKLILFQETNEEQYYRHYILINQYTLYRRISSDFNDFYSIIPNHIAYTINELKTEIEENKKNVLADRCWFKYKNKEKECAFKDILLQAISKASKYEKIILGLSYQDYSASSENIHNSINLNSINIKEIEDKCKLELLRIAMIVNKCQELLNLYPEKANKDVKAFVEGLSDDNILIKPLFQRIYAINDYVCTIDGALARIIKETVSNVGYKSYLVKYLDSRNLPDEYGEYGEYPAHYLNRFHSRKQLEAVTIMNSTPILKELFTEHIPEDKMTEGFDSMMTMFWQNGYKEKVLYDDNTKFAETIKIMSDSINEEGVKEEIEKLIEQKINNI